MSGTVFDLEQSSGSELVMVEWRGGCRAVDEFLDVSDARMLRGHSTFTVGFLVGDWDDDWLSIASTMICMDGGRDNPDKVQVKGVKTIPRGSVITITNLVERHTPIKGDD